MCDISYKRLKWQLRRVDSGVESRTWPTYTSLQLKPIATPLWSCRHIILERILRIGNPKRRRIIICFFVWNENWYLFSESTKIIAELWKGREYASNKWELGIISYENLIDELHDMNMFRTWDMSGNLHIVDFSTIFQHKAMTSRTWLWWGKKTIVGSS